MRKAKYYNLKMVDWNFDYKRNERFHIFGDIVELPTKMADEFPQYFKRVPVKEEEVVNESIEIVKEVESEKLVNSIDESEKIVTEPKNDATLEELFESDLAQGKVKSSKKFYIWNEKKIDKKDYETAENKSEFLFEILN